MAGVSEEKIIEIFERVDALVLEALRAGTLSQAVVEQLQDCGALREYT